MVIGMVIRFKNIFGYVLIAIAFFYFVLAFLPNLNKKWNKELDDDHKFTCTLNLRVGWVYQHGKAIKYDYYVNDKKYSNFIHFEDSIEIENVRYYIMFDPDDPGFNRLLLNIKTPIYIGAPPKEGWETIDPRALQLYKNKHGSLPDWVKY